MKKEINLFLLILLVSALLAFFIYPSDQEKKRRLSAVSIRYDALSPQEKAPFSFPFLETSSREKISAPDKEL